MSERARIQCIRDQRIGIVWYKGGRFLQSTFADPMTDEICHQLAKPFEFWLEPFCLSQAAEITQLNDKFCIAGDRELES